MKIQKRPYGGPAPSSIQEQGFYTEADIKKIVQEAVQDAFTAWMETVDDDPGEQIEKGHAVSGSKLMLSVQEASDLIGISKPKMFELLHAGEISFKRIGKKILISHQNLMDWINQ